MTPEFKDAKLYTCNDDGFIRHSDWSEAILEKLEGDWEKDETVAEQCERIGEITVTAHNPGGVSAAWIDQYVDLMMDRLREDFSEEYGCDDFAADPWPKDNGDWAKKVLTANVTKSLRSAETYNVTDAGSHTFSVEECIEMMK